MILLVDRITYNPSELFPNPLAVDNNAPEDTGNEDIVKPGTTDLDCR
jgi:hypothetical protein